MRPEFFFGDKSQCETVCDRDRSLRWDSEEQVAMGEVADWAGSGCWGRGARALGWGCGEVVTMGQWGKNGTGWDGMEKGFQILGRGMQLVV